MKTKKTKLFFKLFLLIFIISVNFLACNKEKGQEKENTNNNHSINVENNYDKPNDFYINRVSFNDAGHLIAVFSKELNREQNLQEKLSIEPAVEDFEINSYGNKIILKGNFQKEVPYSLNFTANLTDIDGNEIGKTYPFSNLYIAKKKPNLSFIDKASVLSSLNNKRLNFNSTNIKKIHLEVIKIYPNNITAFLKFKDQAYYGERFKEDFGDVVFSKEYDLENKTDETMKNSIDLTGIIDNKGIYRVDIFVNNPDDIDYDESKYGYIDYYDWFDGARVYARAEKNIILSDLGIIANSNANKLNIKTLNINSLDTMANTKLEFISSKNQLLEEGYTNANGEYQTKVNAEDIFYVIAKNGEEFNILHLNENLINYSDFDIGGLVEKSDLRIFTYTDKGYYRPGDEISVSLIARNKNNTLEDNHPFTYSFISPNGVEKINSELINTSKNNFYNFKIKTDINDETGSWNLKIKFGGEEIDKFIALEAKVPNRIAIDLASPKIFTRENLDEDKKLNVNIAAKYLTGANASESQTHYQIKFFEKNIETKKYKNYTFSNPTYDFNYTGTLIGKLDADGKETIKIDIPPSYQKSNLDIFIDANVLDTNGRYSTESKNIKFINSENIIGLQKFDKADGNVDVNFIVLNEKTDSLVAGKKLKYRVFNKQYTWWYDSYENDEKYIKNSINSLITDEGEIISSDSPQTLNLKNLENGINFVEVEDIETGISSGLFIYNYSYGDKAKNGTENLNISSDKAKYEIGDLAKVKFNGTSGAKALISIEKDGKILKEYWKNLTQKENEELVKIEKEYFPNVYVNISMFQSYKDKENDRPLRLYGTIPLMINDSSKQLNIVLDANDEARPSSDYKLKISNKENKKMYFQYYLVDEGILRQTDYKLPKPYEFFYGKQAKQAKIYDNFSNIIEKYSNNKVINYLTTGGGDYAEASPMMLKAAFMSDNMNLQGKAERFKNISIVSKILETDENGFAEIDIKLPNYFGAMKIFVIAVSDDKFGSTEKIVSLKAPVIIETSAPRVLKIGDKFNVPVTLFPVEDNLKTGKLLVKYNGKEFSKDVNFTNKDTLKFDFDLEAPELIGETKIDIIYNSEHYNFKDSIELNVDSPYPQQYISSTKILRPQEEFKINSSEFKDFITNSLDSKLSLSSYENLGLNKVVSSLLDYPYVCLEQTTSKGKAMLAITKLTSDINELNTARNNLNTIIKKLSSNYQLENGSFTYWPGTNTGNLKESIYTTTFLIEAKNQGYYISEQTYNKAIDFLKTYSANNLNDFISMEDRINILYVLALVNEPNISEMNIIFDKYYSNLSTASKLKLLDTYNLIGEKSFAKTEADKLEINSSIDNSVYDSAEMLKNYQSIYGERNKELFSKLLNVLKTDTWLQTYAQANIIEALAKNIEKSERKNLSFIITENGENKDLTLENGQLDIKNITKALRENKEIIIKNTSDSNIYIDFLVKGKPIKFIEEDKNENIILIRKFRDSQGNEIDAKNLKVGDVFSLIISIKSEFLDRTIDNLALVQILPSGWELANTNNFIENSEFDYVDKRDDRIAFFFDQHSNKEKEIKIDLVASTAGDYYFSGTSVEAMYNNSIRAYLKGFDIKVEK